MSGVIAKISGPTVMARDMRQTRMYNLVYVGEKRLLGEVIKMEGDYVTIQVYEETDGLKLGEEVTDSGESLGAELGPGLISSVFDGVQRPLSTIGEEYGWLIPKGISPSPLDRRKRWHFTPIVKEGDTVGGGDIIGTVQETEAIVHHVMVPPGMSGVVNAISEGDFTVDQHIAGLDNGGWIGLLQKWPVRKPRPVRRKLLSGIPFITGQRVIDFLFPLAAGGNVIIPGGFGTGKTVLEQTLAKYAKADIIIYIGCGERGNEMAEVLADFPKLTDPNTGHSLMDRTILIVNTSNMPVAAREASIYTGITLGEYYRDMGYHVAVLADSISRWAEAMREISSRLEELPGEEGFPMHLSSRMATFYERAGMAECLDHRGDERKGAVTICTAISPPGGDFSEPVTQGALRITNAMWALDTDLARRRHFPAIHWGKSFSLYHTTLDHWFKSHIAEDWPALRERLIKLLQKEEELQDMVQLVGPDVLRDEDRIIVETGFIIRENFLQQSPYSTADAFCPLRKQYEMLKIFFKFHDMALAESGRGRDIDEIFSTRRKMILTDLKNMNPERFPDAVDDIMRELSPRL